jgi:NADH-quinone oxidoreductase subunit L
MFVGAGVGAYGNGMFHLMTHAFFKALLFMAAGLVIHHLAGEQDIRLMGGVRHVMPRTFIAFLIGSLALVGIPPLSGFFSKDSILASALASGGWGVVWFAAGVVGALLTGLYTFRLLFIVFFGKPSQLVLDHAHDHPEAPGEGPRTMTAPVAVLSLLAVIGGWIQIAGIWHPFGDWLSESVEPLVEPSVTQDYVTSALAVGAGLLGIGIAWFFYARRPARALPRAAAVRQALEHKLYFDELYDLVFYRPAVLISRVGRRTIEEPLIGGSIEGVTLGARRAGGAVGETQTGYLRSYALAIAAAAAVLVVVFLAVQ